MTNQLASTNTQDVENELMALLGGDKDPIAMGLRFGILYAGYQKGDTPAVKRLAVRSLRQLSLDSSYNSLPLKCTIQCQLIYLMKGLKTNLTSREKELILHLMHRLNERPFDRLNEKTLTSFMKQMALEAEKENKRYPEGVIRDLELIRNITACSSLENCITKAVRKASRKGSFSFYPPGKITFTALKEFVSIGFDFLHATLVSLPAKNSQLRKDYEEARKKINSAIRRKDLTTAERNWADLGKTSENVQKLLGLQMANLQDDLSLLEDHLQHPSFDSATTIPHLVLKIGKGFTLLEKAIEELHSKWDSMLSEADLLLTKEEAEANRSNSALWNFGDEEKPNLEELELNQRRATVFNRISESNTSTLLSLTSQLTESKSTEDTTETLSFAQSMNQTASSMNDVTKGILKLVRKQQEERERKRNQTRKELKKFLVQQSDGGKSFLTLFNIGSRELHNMSSRTALCENVVKSLTALLKECSPEWEALAKEQYKLLLKQQKRDPLCFRLDNTTPRSLRIAKTKKVVEAETKERSAEKPNVTKVEEERKGEEEVKIRSSVSTSSSSSSSSLSSSKKESENGSLDSVRQAIVQAILALGGNDTDAKRYVEDAVYHFQIFMSCLDLIKRDLQYGRKEDAAARFHVLCRAASVMWEEIISAEKVKRGEKEKLSHSHLDMIFSKEFFAKMKVKKESIEQLIEYFRTIDYGTVFHRYPLYAEDLCRKQNLNVPKGIELLMASKRSFEQDLLPFILSTCSALDSWFGEEISLTEMVKQELSKAADAKKSDKEQKKSDLQGALKSSFQILPQMMKQVEGLIEQCVKENTQNDKKSLTYSRELVLREVSFQLRSLYSTLFSWIKNPSPTFLSVHGDLIWTNLQIIVQQIELAMHMKKAKEDYRVHDFFFYLEANNIMLSEKQERALENINIGKGGQYLKRCEQECYENGVGVPEAISWRLKASLVSQHGMDYEEGMTPVFPKGYENCSPQQLEKTLVENIDIILDIAKQLLILCKS